ncbi:histidinol-phosphate aminotransferase [Umbelopsis sp. PMI_123]|nr:histidinol-phosphate aminotransferase [Umbelopsis sp. PMI_123]
MPFDLQKAIRPNILALQPYRCARDDYSTGILLDANENAYGPALSEPHSGELHRYPDPRHPDIKERIVSLRKIPSIHNVFLGVGSDEVIDLLIRIACVPGKDKILITPPTYGMYSVSAQINDVDVVKVNLNVEGGAYQLETDAVNQALKSDPTIKIVFLCSPGNPTSTCLNPDSVRAVLENPDYNGLVAVDEAYIDFVDQTKNPSFSSWITKYPNLVVMQTLSKSFGLAGIRMGVGIGNADVIQILNNTKAPYNISTPTAQVALEALSDKGLATMYRNIEQLKQQRDLLIKALQNFPVAGVGKILGAAEGNFLLIEILNANGEPCNQRAEQVYRRLAEFKDVVVRFRGKEYGCTGCLRISIGTEEEMKTCLKQLEIALQEVA